MKMDKHKDTIKKAIKEYLKESHNRMLKSYHAKHKDIENVISNIDFNNFLKGNGKLVDDKRVNEILRTEQKRFQEDVYKLIQKNMRESWMQGNRMFDKMIQTAYMTDKNRTPELFNWDMTSWNKLKNRQLFSGRTLSGRIWTLSNAYKREILDVLQIGVLNGDSAADLSRRLARYSLYANEKLADIDKLTDKEVRDAVARRNTSKKGSMGTVLKDAKRLAGNESNIAFRESENSRMQSYFVLGFKINLSNAHPREDICDYVNGDYPKWFKWNGWHISCLCYRTFILMSLEEQRAYQKAIRQGKKQKIKGLIEDVPEGFKKYMSENYAQMNSWKSKPYFMVDNDIPTILGEGTMRDISKISNIKSQSTYLDIKSNKIALESGITVTPVDIKSNNRIFEKANIDYNGDISKVKDIVRNTFIVGENKHENIINQVKKDFIVDRIKIQDSNNDPLGYSGTLINIKLPKGGFAEIQINSASVIYGKDVHAKGLIKTELFDKISKLSGLECGLGHKYYEEYRVLDRNIPEQKQRMVEIENLSKDYYNKLRKLGI